MSAFGRRRTHYTSGRNGSKADTSGAPYLNRSRVSSFPRQMAQKSVSSNDNHSQTRAELEASNRELRRALRNARTRFRLQGQAPSRRMA